MQENDHIHEKIKKHYYAYSNIGLDIPEFRITEEEFSQLKSYLLSIFPISPNEENTFMGVKLLIVRKIK